uniref:Uncharacterized protein n=1 Tax=viral metagenome TaxID=1070528 RepID=A0A6C0BV46_9ZZZZ
MIYILETIFVYLLWVLAFLVGLFITVHVIMQITFFYCVLKVSGMLYFDRCLLNFISKYEDYYVDINMLSGEIIKNVKLICDNNLHMRTGILEYKMPNNSVGAILKGKLKNLSLSEMYVDNNNWNIVKDKIRLPTDIIRYISGYICDKNYKHDKIEKSDDKKYFNII